MLQVGLCLQMGPAVLSRPPLSQHTLTIDSITGGVQLPQVRTLTNDYLLAEPRFPSKIGPGGPESYLLLEKGGADIPAPQSLLDTCRSVVTLDPTSPTGSRDAKSGQGVSLH